ncbi:hypothetical protein [Adlercreutzia sp. ZJ141]|uniref:hypothetical protein n=1 Tax=Adlercreutzia sp. ZJ141 TaxID=2709406 RepID=UPI0013EDD2CF|nr:hypothetical protein [Adlercreutzia sp. ZJ141]
MRIEDTMWAVSGTAALARAPHVAPSAATGNVIPFDHCQRTRLEGDLRHQIPCPSLQQCSNRIRLENVPLVRQLTYGTSEGCPFNLFTRKQIAVSAVLFTAVSYLVALV